MYDLGPVQRSGGVRGNDHVVVFGQAQLSTTFDGDLDIPVAAVEGTITLAGGALPSTNTDYDGADIYLVAKDTGAAHHVGGYRYSYSSGSYVLAPDYYGGKVLAGVYDVLYRRYWDSQYDTVSRTTSDKTHVSGYRYLVRDEVVGAGKHTLDLDIPVATVSGTITLAGQPLPPTNTDYDGADIYLVAKDTGAEHHIGGYRYSYSGGSYVLAQNYFGGKVLAGTYDVLYRRYWSHQYDTVSRTLSDKTHVAGCRMLARDVVIASGSQTLNLDIPVATISGTITLGASRCRRRTRTTTGRTSTWWRRIQGQPTTSVDTGILTVGARTSWRRTTTEERFWQGPTTCSIVATGIVKTTRFLGPHRTRRMWRGTGCSPRTW